MGASSSRTPKPKPKQPTKPTQPVEFIIPDNEGYARTSIVTCEAVEFLMSKLEPVNLKDLDPDDLVCIICQEKYHVSENVECSHVPVKTVCGHVFGRYCLIKWLDPLCCWGAVVSDDEDDMDAPLFGHAKTSCPNCRRVFFPKDIEESLPSLTYLLQTWDEGYACAGVARSEKEEHTRKYLWQFVRYCLSVDEHDWDAADRRLMSDLQWRAHTNLRDFAISLKAQKLTPEQENGRERLERIGNSDLSKLGYDYKKAVFIYDIDRSVIKETDDDETDDEETNDDEIDGDDLDFDDIDDDELDGDDLDSDETATKVKTEIDNELTPPADSSLPSQYQEPRSPIVASDGENEWYLELILDSRINRRRKNLLQYLIEWEGGEQTWEPWHNVTNAAKALYDFHTRYPAKPAFSSS